MTKQTSPGKITADVYGPHDNELLIKEALHPYPCGLVIATKGGFVRGGFDYSTLDAVGNPNYLRQSAHMSARRLGVDALDLYYLHSGRALDAPFEARTSWRRPRRTRSSSPRGIRSPLPTARSPRGPPRCCLPSRRPTAPLSSRSRWPGCQQRPAGLSPAWSGPRHGPAGRRSARRTRPARAAAPGQPGRRVPWPGSPRHRHRPPRRRK